MPAIQAPATILVTGASGFIAAWLCKELIDRGFNVRGTVRSEAKGEYLKNLLGDKFTYVVVIDLEHPGGFDEAVKGVDGIAHTASPVNETAEHPDELINPAVNGTIAVLESAKKFAPNVKRVVITSSVATLLTPKPLPCVYSEEDWNESSIEESRIHGRDTGKMIMYRASKTLAEKAAWKFVKDNEGSIKWDIATIMPPFVFGPTIHQATASSLNLTTEMFRSAILNPKPNADIVKQAGNFIDVRDLVHVHAEAFVQEVAGGERWLVAKEPVSWQKVYDILNAAPNLPTLSSATIPKGNPGATKEEDLQIRLNTTKATQKLGFKPRPAVETFVDTLKSLEERGFLTK